MLGELAQLSCIHEYEKTYWVMVEGEPAAAKLVQLERGIQFKDYLTLPAKVRLLPSTVLPPRCQHCAIGRIHLGDLQPSRWRHLTPDEINSLKF